MRGEITGTQTAFIFKSQESKFEKFAQKSAGNNSVTLPFPGVSM